MTDKALAEYAREAHAWFQENTPETPDFKLPLTFMEVGTTRQFDFLRDWQRKVYDAGYLGASWPEAYGGRGLPEAYQSAATRAMVAAASPIMLNAIGLNWAGPLILEMGTEADKKAYIKGILSAEDIWCQGFSEPDNGSDLGNAQTTAVRDGDQWVINGSKIWTTHGSYADYMILLARTNKEAKTKYAGLSFFLTPMKIPGVETHPIRKLTGEYGFTQTFFTDARVDDTCLIGGEGNGWLVAMRTLEYERGVTGGQAGGFVSTKVQVEQVVELARRCQRGGQPVIEDPLLRDDLARLVIEELAVDLSHMRSRHRQLTAEAPHSIPLCSKYMVTEHFRALKQLAIDIQGTQGAYYLEEEEALDKAVWQLDYLNNFSGTIGGGTSQIQLNIIGERVLGLPKS